MRDDNNFDFSTAFSENWNKKVKSIRILSCILGIVMLLCAILCLVYPVESVYAVMRLASVVIVILGVYDMVDYFSQPAYLRRGVALAGSILNILAGILLLTSPAAVTLSTFAFLFGVVLMVAGIDKIAFANRLHFFLVDHYGWVIFSGILNIVGALFLIFMPLAATLVLNYVVAAYLLVGAVTLIIEAISMKTLNIR